MRKFTELCIYVVGPFSVQIKMFALKKSMILLKYDTNELIYETDSQTERTGLWLPRGGRVGEGWSGSLGLADTNYYI